MLKMRDVAIIGAGIAGSSMAKALADKGWDTVLIDRQCFPRHKVCGEFLSPEAQITLQALGLCEYVERLQPSRILRARLIATSGITLEIPLPGAALGVSRFSLDPELHRAARSSGAEVQTAMTVIGVQQNDSGYIVETRQGSHRKAYQARAVIGAWGAQPQTGLSAGGLGSARKNAYLGVKSHYAGIDVGDVVELYFFPGGYLGISPIEGGIVNVAALLSRDAFQNGEKTISGLLQAAIQRNPLLQLKLSAAEQIPDSLAAIAPVNPGYKPIAWERFPHTGDAAAMIPPLCGDGMSMALRSAKLCSDLGDRYLRGELSLVQWEQQYKQAIARQFSGPLRWGELLHRLFGIPALPGLLLGIGAFMPGLAERLVRFTRLNNSDC